MADEVTLRGPQQGAAEGMPQPSHACVALNRSLSQVIRSVSPYGSRIFWIRWHES